MPRRAACRCCCGRCGRFSWGRRKSTLIQPSRTGAKATTQEKPAAALKPDLIGIPAILADFVAEMIVHGSSRDAINSVIYGCLERQYRSFDFAKSVSREELDKGANDWVVKHSDEWSDALAAFRRSCKRIPETKQPKLVTVSERIRAAAKDRLRDQVLDFVKTSSPEDTQLLINVLEDWEGRRAIWDIQPSKESPLASGFEYALSSDRTYVRVPRHLADHIASYANALVNATAVPEVQANA